MLEHINWFSQFEGGGGEDSTNGLSASMGHLCAHSCKTLPRCWWLEAHAGIYKTLTHKCVYQFCSDFFLGGGAKSQQVVCVSSPKEETTLIRARKVLLVQHPALHSGQWDIPRKPQQNRQLSTLIVHPCNWYPELLLNCYKMAPRDRGPSRTVGVVLLEATTKGDRSNSQVRLRTRKEQREQPCLNWYHELHSNRWRGESVPPELNLHATW